MLVWYGRGLGARRPSEKKTVRSVGRMHARTRARLELGADAVVDGRAVGHMVMACIELRAIYNYGIYSYGRTAGAWARRRCRR